MKRNSTKGLSEEDQFLQMATNAKKKAEEEKRKPPVPMPYVNPLSLMFQIEMQRQSPGNTSDGTVLRQTFIGQETRHSTAPLRSLTRISLQEMQVRRRHEGKHLLCRIITPAVRLVSTTFAIEDPNGWAQVISVYNYPGTQYANQRELETLLPVHSVIAIREPWAKMALASDHTHIRIDSPSDIIFLREGDELLANIRWSSGHRPCTILSRSASEWKSVGDKHFREKEYFPASVAYKYALEKQPSLIAARLNRSLALIKLKLYDPALGELRVVLDNTDLPTHEKQKALYRSAQAHYGEGQYEEALKMYQKCLILDETLQEACSGVQLCEKRIAEQTTGSFDWNILCEETMFLGNEPDVANFVGPIKIAPLSHRGGGRGIVATRDIVAGELLLVAKPFAVANQGDNTSNAIIAVNFLTSKLNSSRNLEVLHQCVLKLSMGSDNIARDFFDLYAGNEAAHSSNILSHTEETRSIFARDIDSARIEAVCSLNWFGLNDNHTGLTNVRDINQAMFDLGCALYILPSYFNHACASNANRVFFGSVMVLRASKGIAAGAEVTLSYCSAENPYQERKKVLPKWFPECDCSLCTEDRTAGPSRLSRRESLTKRSESSELNASYAPTHGSFRPALAFAHLRMARELESMSQYTSNVPLLQRSIQHYIFALEAWEIKVIDGSVEGKNINMDSLPIARTVAPYSLEICGTICMAIFRAFSWLCEELRAEKWLRAAAWMEYVTTGGDIHVLKLRHAKLIAALDEQASSLLKKIGAGR